jgi:hypothetical protein
MQYFSCKCDFDMSALLQYWQVKNASVRSYTEVCQTIQTSTELYWYGEVDVAPTSLFFVKAETNR